MIAACTHTQRTVKFKIDADSCSEKGYEKRQCGMIMMKNIKYDKQHERNCHIKGMTRRLEFHHMVKFETDSCPRKESEMKLFEIDLDNCP